MVLVDYGLAGFYFYDKTMTTFANSKYYKPPELLTHQRRYEYSIDVWATGTMFASMILTNTKDHFFRRLRQADIAD